MTKPVSTWTQKQLRKLLNPQIEVSEAGITYATWPALAEIDDDTMEDLIEVFVPDVPFDTVMSFDDFVDLLLEVDTTDLNVASVWDLVKSGFQVQLDDDGQARVEFPAVWELADFLLDFLRSFGVPDDETTQLDA